jgi:hypothetical protein
VGASYEEKLTTIVRICAGSNPDLSKRAGRGAIAFEIAARVRLADVMLTVLQDSSKRRSEEVAQSLTFWWNLRQDSLVQQSDECVGFLFDRLREISFFSVSL